MGEVRKLRRTSGFTLVEVLITVAVLAVIASFAMPAFSSFLKDSKMAELDHGAKQIFLAAQNRMISMRTAGVLSSIDQPVSLGTVSLADDAAAGIIKDYSYVDTAAAGSDAAVKKILGHILPVGVVSNEIYSGHYILIFDTQTGLMRGVLYSEHWLDSGRIRDLMDNFTLRREQLVGFYDGGGVVTPDVAELPAPILTVENGERLLVKIQLPVTITDPTQVQVKLTVEHQELSGQNVTWNLDCRVAAGNGFDEVDTSDIRNKTYIKVLDELSGTVSESGAKSFDAVCSSIAAGANIRITASLVPVPSASADFRPSISVSQETNSLFDSMELEGDTVRIRIATGRHLQNLRWFSGWGRDIFTPEMLPTLTSGMRPYFTVEQSNRIDWTSYYGRKGISFYPLEDIDYLKSFNGNGLEISGLRVLTADGAGGAGIFGRLGAGRAADGGPACVFTSVNIVDPVIRAGGSSTAAGALAGITSKTRFTDCHVFVKDTANLNNYGVWSGDIAGGLIGMATGASFNHCSASMPNVVVRTNSGTAGGLVGTAVACSSLINSYGNTGNLASSASSYAAGALVGSVIPSSVEMQVRNSYGIGNISGRWVYPSGLIGNGLSSKLSNCYALTTFAGASLASPGINNSFHGVAYGANLGSILLCLTRDVSAVPGDAGFEPQGATFANKDEFFRHFFDDGNWGMVSATGTFPYSNALRGLAYPYPVSKGAGGGNTVYGDWPQLGG